MRRVVATLLMSTTFTFSLAAIYKQGVVLEVVSTSTPTLTSLSGTWNQVIIHNNGPVAVGYCLESADDSCEEMVSYETRKGEIPVGASVEIKDRNVRQIKHITPSPSDESPIVIERVRKIN